MNFACVYSVCAVELQAACDDARAASSQALAGGGCRAGPRGRGGEAMRFRPPRTLQGLGMYGNQKQYTNPDTTLCMKNQIFFLADE